MSGHDNPEVDTRLFPGSPVPELVGCHEIGTDSQPGLDLQPFASATLHTGVLRILQGCPWQNPPPFGVAWLILWLVLIPLHSAALGTGRFWRSEGDEGWQLLQAAAWLGVLLFPKLHLLLRTGGSRNFPIILVLSWIIPA